MRQKAGPQKPAAEQVIKDIHRATRKHHSAEDKIRRFLQTHSLGSVWHLSPVIFWRLAMFKGRHFEQSVIILCVRWYLTYGRDLKEMVAERGISVEHSTIHRWVVHFSPMLADRFNRRKRAVSGRWHADETYIKVRGGWMYLYSAIDSSGDTVEFWLSDHRDLSAAKRFFRKAFARHGWPERIVIDGSQTNREAIISCDTISRLQDRAGRRPEPVRIRQVSV